MNDPLAEPEIARSPFSVFRFPLVYSVILLIALCAFSAWAWASLPENARVPIHWDASGRVNGWSGKGALFLFPGLLLFYTLLFPLLPYIDPRKANLIRSSKAYSALWIAMNTFAAGCGASAVLAALGRPNIMAHCISIGTGLLLCIVGNYMGKIRSNFFCGIRTPWTLSSELSWNKTHRLAGWMFVGFGLLLIVWDLAQVDGKIPVIATIGFVATVFIVLFPYSYSVWKADPDRGGPAKPATPVGH